MAPEKYSGINRRIAENRQLWRGWNLLTYYKRTGKRRPQTAVDDRRPFSTVFTHERDVNEEGNSGARLWSPPRPRRQIILWFSCHFLKAKAGGFCLCSSECSRAAQSRIEIARSYAARPSIVYLTLCSGLAALCARVPTRPDKQKLIVRLSCCHHVSHGG